MTDLHCLMTSTVMVPLRTSGIGSLLASLPSVLPEILYEMRNEVQRAGYPSIPPTVERYGNRRRD